jgi:hypothetical protein
MKRHDGFSRKPKHEDKPQLFTICDVCFHYFKVMERDFGRRMCVICIIYAHNLGIFLAQMGHFCTFSFRLRDLPNVSLPTEHAGAKHTCCFQHVLLWSFSRARAHESTQKPRQTQTTGPYLRVPHSVNLDSGWKCSFFFFFVFEINYPNGVVVHSRNEFETISSLEKSWETWFTSSLDRLCLFPFG